MKLIFTIHLITEYNSISCLLSRLLPNWMNCLLSNDNHFYNIVTIFLVSYKLQLDLLFLYSLGVAFSTLLKAMTFIIVESSHLYDKFIVPYHFWNPDAKNLNKKLIKIFKFPVSDRYIDLQSWLSTPYNIVVDHISLENFKLLTFFVHSQAFITSRASRLYRFLRYYLQVGLEGLSDFIIKTINTYNNDLITVF